MPATSKAQQKLMQMAEHHPEMVSAKNRGVLSMSHQQLHDFASGSEKGKPAHVKKPKKLGGMKTFNHFGQRAASAKFR